MGENLIDRYHILYRLHIVAAIGCLLIFLYSLRFWGSGDLLRIVGIGILVAGAALLSGFLAGFIFGVPRVGSEKPAENAVTPNSNLVEISDWLTKILVGVGLVELNSIPARLGKLSYYLGPGLRPALCDARSRCADYVSSGQVAGLTIIIFYFPLGFLLGYVWTRLYFQRDLTGQIESLQQENQALQQKKQVADQVKLAEAKIEEGQLDEALKTIDEALKTDPSDGRVVLTKARILKRQASQAGSEAEKKALLTDALTLVSEAAKLLPGRVEPIYNKACYQALLGFDKSEILENLKIAFRLDSTLAAVAARDEDLVSLRQDHDFIELTSGSSPAGS